MKYFYTITLLIFILIKLLFVESVTITLPTGFHIEVYADDITSARAIRYKKYNNDTIVFVGTGTSYVYGLIDINSDHIIDYKYKIFTATKDTVNSIVLSNNGDLYISEQSMIYKCTGDLYNQLINNHELTQCSDFFSLPDYSSHGKFYLNISPNNKLCVNFGSPCNVCIPTLPQGTIQCFDLDNPSYNTSTIVAYGIRNSVGFDWHPITGTMWFSDNGRDNLGDNIPDDELNRIDTNGKHYGFPYCHSEGSGNPYIRNINNVSFYQDPTYTAQECNDTNYVKAVQAMGPHVGVLGVKFNNINNTNFPLYYNNSIFIAQHGSWNRNNPIGYRIMLVELENDNTNIKNYSIFAQGWLDSNNNVNGRPCDIEFLDDGSLLVSDDYANALYRIYYNTTINTTNNIPSSSSSLSLSSSSLLLSLSLLFLTLYF